MIYFFINKKILKKNLKRNLNKKLKKKINLKNIDITTFAHFTLHQKQYCHSPVV